jgi:ABC-type lipoprotein export system ATPase subunit
MTTRLFRRMLRPLPPPSLSNGDGTFIRMQRVVKTFRTPAGDFTALKGIDTDFYKGEFVSIIGKSGSGKSTLVNMITGIDRPSSGQIQIGGAYVHTLSESQMSRWRGCNLGIVFQFYQLLPMLSLLENTMLPMDISQVYAPSEREARAMALLEMVGLAEVAHKRPAAVSGGQQQSAAIARALANDPPLIVADEPTGNLDSRAAERVVQVFDGLARQNKTIIMVTHDNSLAQRASRTMLLVDGEIVNPTIASTLPCLTHQQMLKATHQLHTLRFEPGETIIHQGQPNHRFYMIAEGFIEITLEQVDGSGTSLARMGPGQYFGEVTMLRQGPATARVKASEQAPVKVVALEREAFTHMMAEAHAAREAIMHTAARRLEENTAHRLQFKARESKGNVQTALA